MMQTIPQRIVAATLMLLFCGAFFVTPLAAFAEAAPEGCAGETIKLEVGLGDVDEVRGLNDYLAKLYQFIISSIAILSAASIMLNGIRWAGAGGNSEQISKAKDGITAAIIGLVLAIGSYVLLNTLNPALVNPGDICPKGIVVPVTGTSTGAKCETAAECKAGNKCEANASGVKVCVPESARENGEACTQASDCISGICNVTSNQCSSGDGTDNYTCVATTDCADGYVCSEMGTDITLDDRCVAPYEGARCTTDDQCWDGQSSPRLMCIDEDDQCHDGSIEDPCDTNYDCVSKHCGNNVCTDGINDPDPDNEGEPAPCDVSEGNTDCAEGYVCNDGTFSNTCVPE